MKRVSWRGKSVLITSGPTREHLDPVRFMSNGSSGKMGFALAAACRRRGARVVVVSGPSSAARPRGVRVVRVLSALEMRREALKRAAKADVFIGAAAVGDWRFARTSPHKLAKSGKPLTLTLLPNPDILKDVGRLRRGERPYLVGFALQTKDWLGEARRKLSEKGLDLIVANRARSLNSDRTTIALLSPGRPAERLAPMSKERAAERIVERLDAALREARA